jgi:anti-anti-sigma factor
VAWWNARSSRDPSPGDDHGILGSSGFRLIHDGTVRLAVLKLPLVVDDEDFDRISAQLLEAVAAEPGGAWVLDLSPAEYFGSAMLGLLVNIRQVIRQGQGRLVLCGLSEELMKVISVTSMERLFQFQRTRADAIRQVSR